MFLNRSKMVFVLLLPVHTRYGLVLQSRLGRAEDGESWIWASSRRALHTVSIGMCAIRIVSQTYTFRRDVCTQDGQVLGLVRTKSYYSSIYNTGEEAYE